ncbi:MAG: hypothetical protein HYX33_00925 [Actinobacteria bacterium]|nr:hypothetical protein [Actinomycetota bacterium]
MNAAELFAEISALAGSREAGGTSNGIAQSRLVNRVEYARVVETDEAKLRSTWKRRQGGGSTPLVVVADDPAAVGAVLVLGPDEQGPVRRLRTDAMRDLVARTAAMGRLEAVRHLAEEVARLDTEGVAGLTVRGLGTEHLFKRRLPASLRWSALRERVEGVRADDWRALLVGLGYELEPLPHRGVLARASGRPALVVHSFQSAAQFARLDDQGRLPEGALVSACMEHGVAFGLLVAGSRLRLLSTSAAEAGTTTRYLDLDVATLEPADRPLLGLLAPESLVDGELAAVLAEARDYGQALRLRLDRVLRQQVMPTLGREIGRWAAGADHDLSDDRVRERIEGACLTFVFRALFLLYAESAGHLPMGNQTYAGRSLTRVCARAAEELDVADARSTSLWRDMSGLVDAMREGNRAWAVPAYNGDLFADDRLLGADLMEDASIPDAHLAPVLVALGRDPDDPATGVDFSGLEVGHLGHIYEGLLSLRLSVADRDYTYDAKSDRYVPATEPGAQPDTRAGELLWLTNEGGRKSGGVYYTRTELVRHLVRGAVRPALARHLDAVRATAATDPPAAAEQLFEFFVLDPACGSAHFLVEVLDELADGIATFLGEVALPQVRATLDSLRGGATAFGAGIEDTALLKRVVLKRCIYGVDLSPMGAAIAKVSLWLASFVPGLSLAYLDHNVQIGNSLVGVARPDDVRPPDESNGQVAMFGDAISDALAAAARRAADLRRIEDRTPDEVATSRSVHDAMRIEVEGATTLFDLWTAEPLGVKGARDDVLLIGQQMMSGSAGSLLADAAREKAVAHRFLHWPIAFAEVFARKNPGFDAAVGNPPWDEITVERLAFLGRYRPGLRSLPEKARGRAVAELLSERPELEERFAEEQRRLAGLRSYFGPATGYAGGPGDPDTYKYFCQRYRTLVRDDGSLGVVLPRTAFNSRGSSGFREWLFEEASPRRLDLLVNRSRWAFDAEARLSVALLVAERRPGSPVMRVAGVARSAADFDRQAESPGIELSHSALGPQLEVPSLSTQRQADVLAKLRVGQPFPLGAERWRCFPVREFDETNDKKLWDGKRDGFPLWKGESFDQFDPNGAGARSCPPSPAALAKARKPRPGSESLLGSAPLQARRDAVARTFPRARVAFRDVSRSDDSRTIRACLIPPNHFLTNKAPYLAFIDDGPRCEAACLALMNSLCFDWQARRFVEINVNFFILEGLRLPSLDDETFDALATAAARLSCVDDRFTEFAAATGVVCEALSDEERERLRADIDARVALAWSLSADDLDVVFDDFTMSAVPVAYRDRVRARFQELGGR